MVNSPRDIMDEMRRGSSARPPIVSHISEQLTRNMSIRQMLTRLKGYDVLVGVPAEDTARDDSMDVTNAELVYIHTHGTGQYAEAAQGLYTISQGSPAKGIPPRPIIEPALAANMDAIRDKLRLAVEKFTQEDYEAGEQRLKATGMYCQNVVRAWFTDPRNMWPPLAESTKRAKAKHGKSKDNPLIDTGELRKSITYVIRTPQGGRQTGANNANRD